MIHRRNILLMGMLMYFLVPVKSHAVVYYSRVLTGNWNTNSTWSTVTYGNVTNAGTYPGASDTAMIADSNTVIVNTSITVAKISVGQGISGILQYSNGSNYTLTVTGDITVNNGGKFWYSNNSTKTHTLKVTGNFINNGVVDFYYDSNDLVNITFNGSVSDTVSGNGTWDLNTVTLSKSILTSYLLDVQAIAFESGTRTLSAIYGTYIHDNSGSYSVNSSSASNFTISQNVIFKVPQGTVTFSPLSATLNLQGALYINGGNVYVGLSTGTGGIRYSQPGGVVPYLEISSGFLDVYGALTNNSASDPINFSMSGGSILLHNGLVGTSQDIFFITDLSSSSFSMSGGSIVFQSHNLSGGSNVDFAIPGSNGTVLSTGGTIQFGNASTLSGTVFDYQPFPNVVMPNIKITGTTLAAITLQSKQSATADFKLLSLYIDTNKTFDIRSISGTNGDSKKLTLTSTYDGRNAFYNRGTFTARTGEVIFAGTSAQTIAGSATTSFYDLTINNTDSVILNNPENVTDYLSMLSGKLKTSASNIISCTSTANANIGSSTSYVDGPMNQIVAQSTARTINFPIGKGAFWRPVVFTPLHSSASSATYMAEVINSSAAALPYALTGSLSKVSSMRYWNLVRSGAVNFSNATIKLYYGSDDGVTNYASLRVAQGLTGNWVNDGGTGTANGSGTITSGSFSTFSNIFTLGNVPGGTNPLPIRLLSFTCEKKETGVLIKWTTATEINNDYFTVESSEDAEHYTEILSVPGAGNSSSMLSYNAMDYSSWSGIHYYRLKQTDFDGEFSYSQAIKIQNDEQYDFFISPNPSTGEYLDVHLNATQNTDVTIGIYDSKGSSVYKNEIRLENDEKQIRIKDLNFVDNGIYYVTVSEQNIIRTKKLIVLMK